MATLNNETVCDPDCKWTSLVIIKYIVTNPMKKILCLMVMLWEFVLKSTNWLMRPLWIRCEALWLARELCQVNQQMKCLGEQFETLKRHYQLSFEKIRVKQRQLAQRREDILRRLALLDSFQFSTTNDMLKQDLIEHSDSQVSTKFKSLKNDFQNVAHSTNVNAKRMAKWFDRQFSCGVRSENMTKAKTQPSSYFIKDYNSKSNHFETIQPNLTVPKISEHKPKLKLIIKQCHKSEEKHQNIQYKSNLDKKVISTFYSTTDAVIDQMASETLQEFRNSINNWRLRKHILELYTEDGSEWKPVIEQLKTQYKLFSYI